VEKVDENGRGRCARIQISVELFCPDGDHEEMEENEFGRYPYPNPALPYCLGRELQCVKLFGGT